MFANKTSSRNNNNIALIFCENIYFLRKKHNLSQIEMAQMLGIGVKSLRSLEKGKVPPKLNCDIIFNIYNIFNISPSDIFSPLEDNKNK